MTEPISLESIVDVEGLASKDAGRYRDVIWHVGPDPEEDDALVLQRPLSDRELFRAQVIAAPGSPTRRERINIRSLRARKRGEDPHGWPHFPLARANAAEA